MLNFFISLIKISLSAFGGGAVIISLMQKEFVDTGLVAVNDFIIAIGITQITPGPAAPGIVAFIAYRLYGIVGVVVSCLGVFLPTLVLSICFLKLADLLKKTRVLDSIYLFLKPITVALILSVVIFLAGISIFNETKPGLGMFSNISIVGILIFLGSTFGIIKFKLNPVYIVLASGVLGMVLL